MGNNPSKPTEHVFYGETPVQFSHNLVNALESSTESDSTRAKSSNLHIAQLVHDELQRLQSREDDILHRLATDSPLSTSAAVEDVDDPLSTSRTKLAEKVSGIKSRLESIPGVVREEGQDVADEEVKRARGEVVRCLRFNDRKPLECWEEVERFREVARRRERGFVSGVVGK